MRLPHPPHQRPRVEGVRLLHTMRYEAMEDLGEQRVEQIIPDAHAHGEDPINEFVEVLRRTASRPTATARATNFMSSRFLRFRWFTSLRLAHPFCC